MTKWQQWQILWQTCKKTCMTPFWWRGQDGSRVVVGTSWLKGFWSTLIKKVFGTSRLKGFWRCWFFWREWYCLRFCDKDADADVYTDHAGRRGRCIVAVGLLCCCVPVGLRVLNFQLSTKLFAKNKVKNCWLSANRLLPSKSFGPKLKFGKNISPRQKML